MANPFEYINKPLKPVPEELKSKVMNDIAMAKLALEMAELFSVDMAKVVESVMDKKNKRKKNN